MLWSCQDKTNIFRQKDVALKPEKAGELSLPSDELLLALGLAAWPDLGWDASRLLLLRRLVLTSTILSRVPLFPLAALALRADASSCASLSRISASLPESGALRRRAALRVWMLGGRLGSQGWGMRKKAKVWQVDRKKEEMLWRKCWHYHFFFFRWNRNVTFVIQANAAETEFPQS